MRVAMTVRDWGHDTVRDVLLDADADLLVDDLAPLLAGPAPGTGPAHAPHHEVFVRGLRLEPGLPLRSAGLLDGALVELGRTDVPPPAPAGLLEVGVVAGPGSGTIHRIGPGRHTAGRDPSCSVVLTGEGVAPVAAEIRVDARLRVQVRVVDEAAGVTLGGRPLSGLLTPWSTDQQLSCGPTLLEVRATTEPDAALEAAEEGGWLSFNRPPRLDPQVHPTSFRIPARPAPASRSPWPWLTALLPVVLGVVMAVVFRSYLYLAFAVMTPVVVFGNAITSRRQGKRTARQQVQDHEVAVTTIEADVEAARAAERLARRTASPGAAELWSVATGPHSRLWERRPSDTDYLLVRVGTANAPSAVAVEDMREDVEHRRRVPGVLADVPAAFSLPEAGVAGIAGTGGWPQQVARWLVGQVAVLHSPQDVQVYLLTAAAGRDAWAWARWLPHVRPALGQDARMLVGNDAETLGRRVAELVQLITDRRARERDAHRDTRGPDVVVVMDGARRLRVFPGIVTVLRDGPAVGVHSICLDDSEHTLPEECQAVVALRPDRSVVLRRRASDPVQHVRTDEVAGAWFDEVSRALAPLRDLGDDQDGAIPTTARLLDVLRLDPPTAEAVRAGWSEQPRSTRAVVGVSLDGPFALDLVRDGPHALVAGTTGSGKSELLQTLVASLAVANRPDAMNFVLVDYKGGAAFKDCVRLPHTVGMVTDLDANLVERALTSLGAELTRREHLLAGAGAKDIEDYLDLLARRPALEAMPRLLIVIDEFASMARELPDFVTGLVNIAQRGRSLGIHLLLATQRPSGVVSGEIRANTNLRIALRVTDGAESTDVIDSSAAAGIPAAVPGRAYVRLGQSSLVPFQTARVGGRSPAAQTQVRAPFLAELSWGSAGYPPPAAPAPDETSAEVTDLSTLVDVVGAAGAALALPAQHSPWLAPLPSSLLLRSLEDGQGGSAGEDARAETTGGRPPTAPWALVDLPASQEQSPVHLDLSTLGHLFVVGAPRSGRSQVLRTMAASMASRIGSGDLHLFGVDCGNGALLALADLPHTGAVVQRTEKERIVRLFERLGAEVLRRQELLGAAGVADVTEQRQHAVPEDRLPHLVLVLDRWEGFVDAFGDQDAGALVEQVLTFLREGASVGLHLVLAGDRSLLTGRISVLTDDKWVLRLADRSDYGMAGLNPRKVAEHLPPGRAVRAVSGNQAQVALLDADPGAPAQAAAVAAVAAVARERDRGVPAARRPMRIDTLPSRLTFEDAARYPAERGGSPTWALLGVGGDELTGFGADLGTGAPAFLVAGPARSGRSNLLAVMTRSLLEDGCPVVLWCPRRSPLQDLFTDAAGVRATLSGTDVGEDVLAPLLEGDGQRVVLVIDDGELLRDVACKDYLRTYLRGAAGTGRGMVLGGNAADVGGGFSNWQTDVRNYQRGALLSPRNIFDGDLVGVRVPRSAVAAPIAPGRAMVHLGTGTLSTVQVPRVVP